MDAFDEVVLKPFEDLMWTNPETGEVLVGMDVVRFAYTREGRRVVGLEFPNPTPVDPPLGFVPEEPLHEQIRRRVLNELRLQQLGDESDTPDEADDFDVGDDYDPNSPYELDAFDEWPPRSDAPVGDVPEANSQPAGETPSETPAEAAGKGGS